MRTDAEIIAELQQLYISAQNRGTDYIAISRANLGMLLASATPPPVPSPEQGAHHDAALVSLAVEACMTWHFEQAKRSHPIDAATHAYCARELAKLKVSSDGRTPWQDELNNASIKSAQRTFDNIITRLEKDPRAICTFDFIQELKDIAKAMCGALSGAP